MSEAKPKSVLRKVAAALLVAGLIAAVIGFVEGRRQRWPEGLMLANGRIEGDR